MRLARATFLALITLLVMAIPQAASAHAGLVDSDPRQDATLRTAPTSVTLTFSEELQQPGYLALKGPDGEQVPISAPSFDGPRISADVTGEAGGGAWALSYRVVSADGHPVTGTIPFEVDAPAAAPSESPSPSEESEAAAPEADTTSAQTAPASATTEHEHFLVEHREHLLLGLALVALAAVLVMVGRRRAAR
ncbi:hypothetical protein GCM10027425_07560 [Alteromonas gracilis]